MTTSVLPKVIFLNSVIGDPPHGALNDEVFTPTILVDRWCALVFIPDPGRHFTTSEVIERWRNNRPSQLRQADLDGATLEAVDAAFYFSLFGLSTVSLLARRLMEANRHTKLLPSVWQVDLRTSLVTRSAYTVQPPAVPDSSVPVEPKFDDTSRSSSERLRRAEDFRLEQMGLLDDSLGVLGRRAQSDLDSPATAKVFGYFNSVSNGRVHPIHWGGHTTAFARSRAVGLIEGIERHAGSIPHAKRTVIHSSMEELRTRALDPRQLGAYPMSNVDKAEMLSFTDATVIPWVRAWSLTRGEEVLIPEMLGYHDMHREGFGLARESSNGAASGATLAEAALHGLLEVVERDCFMTAWYGGLPLDEVPLCDVRSNKSKFLAAQLSHAGYEVRLFDATLTLPIPAVIAVAVRRSDEPGKLCFGAAANLSVEAAIYSALDEIASDVSVAQARAVLRRDDIPEMLGNFALVTAMEDHTDLYADPRAAFLADFLLAQENPGISSLARSAPQSELLQASGSPARDLEACVESIAADGYEVLMLDQTTPIERQVGLWTAKAIVPGFVPIDFGWYRQRALTSTRLVNNAANYMTLRKGRQWTGLNLAPHPFP